METPQYRVNWIFDTDPQAKQFRGIFQFFHYRWIYLPTGQTNIRTILCRNAGVFAAFLEKMNGSSPKWQYMVVTDAED